MSLDPSFVPGAPIAPFLVTAPDWDEDTDDTLVCRAVRQETHDVKTFVLAPRTARRFVYRPGQFMSFELPIAGETVSRCYTLSSAPTRPNQVSITVKRVAGGLASNWLHDNLRPGAILKASGPLGDFTAGPRPQGKYLFLTGGSGITPLMSMARTWHDLGEEPDLVFVHNARTPQDIIFRAELAEMARIQRGFRFVPVCGADSPAESWTGLRGHLSLEMLRLMVPDFESRRIFTCGPAPYMAAVRAMLDGIGFPMDRYHEERFDGGDAEPAPVLDAAPTAETFRIEFSKQKRSIDCAAGTTVLAAARAAGLRLPMSCGKGICGTCKVKKLSGEVEMNHGGGIRQRDIDQGMVLLCCSTPRSDLVIER